MVYVFLADGFEEIEAVTTIDILRRAELDVRIAGVGGRLVRGAHGITICADAQVEELDTGGVRMIVLPGGMPGTLHLERSESVSRMIDYAAENGVWIAAICAAPSILGHKGLLNGRKAVCYPGFEEQLAGAAVTGSLVETDGRYITANGPGAAVEFALELVARLVSRERAQKLRASL